MTLNHKFACLLLGLALTGVDIAFGQELNLVKNSELEPLTLLPIASDPSTEGKSVKTNVKTYFSLNHWNGAANFDGSVLVSGGNVLKKTAAGFEKLSIPESDRIDFGYPCIDQSGKTVAYITQPDNVASVAFFDTEKQNVSSRYVHVVVDVARRMGHFTLSGNAKSFAFTILEGGREPAGHYIYIVERLEDGTYQSKNVAIADFVQSKLYLSPSGNRLVYRATVNSQTREATRLFVVDKVNGEWQSPKELSLPEIAGDQRLIPPLLFDIANDGKTVLVWCRDGLALVKETNGVWSEPEYVGYQPSFYDEAQIAEDGSVIAVTAARLPVNDVMNDYDGYLIAREKSGEWKKKKVNSEGWKTVGSMLLPDDGKSLYWVPEKE